MNPISLRLLAMASLVITVVLHIAVPIPVILQLKHLFFITMLFSAATVLAVDWVTPTLPIKVLLLLSYASLAILFFTLITYT